MILVTGGTGFLGTELIKSLGEEEQEYIIFRGDLNNVNNIEECFKKYDITVIVHLVGSCKGSKKDLLHINFTLTENLLKVASKFDVQKIIYSSTGAVYGREDDVPSHEDDICTPNTTYGEVKSTTEQLLTRQCLKYGISLVVLRFSHIYGKSRKQGVIYHFLKGIEDKSQITLYGDGTQTRNFIHVKDAVQAILRSLNPAIEGVFNIGSFQNITLNDLIDVLKRKYEFSISQLPANNDLTHLVLDISKSQKILGFKPTYKLIF